MGISDKISDILERQIKYSRFCSRYISVWNEYTKRWNITIEFNNIKERDVYFEYLVGSK